MGELLELVGGVAIVETLAPAILRGAAVGLGLGVVLGAVGAVAQNGGTLTANAMQAGMAAGNQVQRWTSGLRAGWDDLVAEAQGERRGGTPGTM